MESVDHMISQALHKKEIDTILALMETNALRSSETEIDAVMQQAESIIDIDDVKECFIAVVKLVRELFEEKVNADKTEVRN